MSAHEALEVSVLREGELAAVAKLRYLAFAEKRCFAQSEAEWEREFTKGYEQQRAKEPQKNAHCAVVRGEDGGLLAACQLQLPGDGGDYGMPGLFRHKLKEGEAYVEWIGVSEAARGKGLGSKLLAWADDKARQHGCTHITLEVMTTNPALRLYERHGYTGAFNMRKELGEAGPPAVLEMKR